jgi:hypothetical protein
VTEYKDRIKPTDNPIGGYIDDLREKEYQIPTFQREVVWEKKNIKKLWDSIYRFYPIGSILIWKDDIELEKHRSIGGHEINDPNQDGGFKYILDGQQRTTALLTSLYGVDPNDWQGNFDPTLYIDLSIEEAEDVEDSNFQDRFLFADEFRSEEEILCEGRSRDAEGDARYIVKLRDVMERYEVVEEYLHDSGHGEYRDPIRVRLRNLGKVFRNYRIPFIELEGIDIDEVTEIFERVNQEGQPLDIFDIVVAKTFRPESHPDGGFYLREKIERFREETDGEFVRIGNSTYLQMLAMIINYHVDDNDVHNITDTYLPNIKTHHIEEVWDDAVVAFRQTFDFFENHLHIKGPSLIPYRYYYITFAFYFFRNDDPDYDLLQTYFWYYAFHNEDKLSHTRHLRNDHLDWFHDIKNGKEVDLDSFVLDKNDLRTASYSYRGRFSRAILCLLSYQEPKDWKHQDRSVISEVYYQLQDKPQLHHIFPLSFIEDSPVEDRYDADSMMNIAFLPALTNLEISDKNPVDYLLEYDSETFESVLESHLIPSRLLDMSRDEEIGYVDFDDFIEARVEEFKSELQSILTGVEFNVIDTDVYDENVELLIEDGEGDTLELKSSFRTDVDGTGIPQRRVEFQCLKAINGFLNSPEGGKLLIGVQDDGSVYGLSDDFDTFQEDQKLEVFERHLRNKISSSMDDRFNDFVEITFLTLHGKDVALVNVSQATKPSHIEDQGDQKFYVRRGNRTEPIDPKDQHEYITDHFE